MQFPWDEHFHQIVIPAWQAYLASERRLTDAVQSDDLMAVGRARYDALREGGAASIYLHHYSEIVLRARPSWLPDDVIKLRQLREWVRPHCTALRSDVETDDVSLLGDVADALKHAVLTINPDRRAVAANDAVLVCRTGYGGGRFGEGKFDGGDQVLVLARNGQRALSAILQNVVDSWRRVAGLDLPPLGQP